MNSKIHTLYEKKNLSHYFQTKKRMMMMNRMKNMAKVCEIQCICCCNHILIFQFEIPLNSQGEMIHAVDVLELGGRKRNVDSGVNASNPNVNILIGDEDDCSTVSTLTNIVVDQMPQVAAECDIVTDSDNSNLMCAPQEIQHCDNDVIENYIQIDSDIKVMEEPSHNTQVLTNPIENSIAESENVAIATTGVPNEAKLAPSVSQDIKTEYTVVNERNQNEIQCKLIFSYIISCVPFVQSCHILSSDV